jgi:hypothetical protein
VKVEGESFGIKGVAFGLIISYIYIEFLPKNANNHENSYRVCYPKINYFTFFILWMVECTCHDDRADSRFFVQFSDHRCRAPGDF